MTKKLCLVVKLSAFIAVLPLYGMRDRLNEVLLGKEPELYTVYY